MKKSNKSIQQLKAAQPMTATEMNQTKGGIALTCEEKRGNFLGLQYNYMQWSLKPDGKLWLSIQM